MTLEDMVYSVQHEGNKEYMLDIWEQLRRFIYKQARQHIGEIDDLMQESYIALCTAVDTFDLSKGTKFITYAGKCINWHLYRYTKGSTNIPKYGYTLMHKYYKLIEKYRKEHIKPTEYIIMRDMGLSHVQYKNFMSMLVKVNNISLHTQTCDDSEDELIERIADEHSTEQTVIERVAADENAKLIWETVGKLPELEAYAVEQHYRNDKTFKEIAEHIGLSYNGTAAKCNAGLSKLRSNRLMKEIAKDYDITFSLGLRHNGISAFSRTNTSSTEYAALKLIEWEGVGI